MFRHINLGSSLGSHGLDLKFCEPILHTLLIINGWCSIAAFVDFDLFWV